MVRPNRSVHYDLYYLLFAPPPFYITFIACASSSSAHCLVVFCNLTGNGDGLPAARERVATALGAVDVIVSTNLCCLLRHVRTRFNS
jgi:hypothetical protein